MRRVQLLKKARDLIIVDGTEGRNPFEVLMLTWSAAVGASLVFGSPTSGSLMALLPNWMVTTWYTILCIGGLVGLVGVWLKNLILSLLVERAGMLIVGPSALLYSVALFSLGGVRTLGPGGLTLAFAVAALIRIVRIAVQLRRVRDLLGTVAKK